MSETRAPSDERYDWSSEEGDGVGSAPPAWAFCSSFLLKTDFTTTADTRVMPLVTMSSSDSLTFLIFRAAATALVSPAIVVYRHEGMFDLSPCNTRPECTMSFLHFYKHFSTSRFNHAFLHVQWRDAVSDAVQSEQCEHTSGNIPPNKSTENL